jgi:biopolymer transport protein ExbD
MVDLFTVLAVFLLQNYNVTGQVIELSQDVELPQAGAVKELKPSTVVTLSPKELKFDDEYITDFLSVKEQQDWLIEPLRQKLVEMIDEGEKQKFSLKNQLRNAVNEARVEDSSEEEEVDAFRKITIQADQEVDFLSIKKVMYTATEAGIYEINFAVIKRDRETL